MSLSRLTGIDCSRPYYSGICGHTGADAGVANIFYTYGVVDAFDWNRLETLSFFH